MNSKLALLAAIGQIATAFEGPGGNDASPTKPLATVTSLENGHLPTCFTGHPTHPCPTYKAKRDSQKDLNDLARKAGIKPISMSASSGAHHLPTQAPAVAIRDAPLKVSRGDYIPEPNEWAIPQDFTFTDTISNRTNASVSSTDSVTTSTSGHADLRTAIAQMADNMIDSITRDMMPTPAIPTETGHPTGIPTALAQEHNATNSSSSAHLTGTVGTLLSQAMFPGKMRAAATTSSSLDETTASPSIEAIPMSQSPNTTAAEGTVQAFIHPINTETPISTEATTSSNATSSAAIETAAPSLPEAAHQKPSSTNVPTGDWDEAKFDKELDEQLAAFDKESSTIEERNAQNDEFDYRNTRENSRQWDEQKFDKELDAYLGAVLPEETPSSSTTVSATASIKPASATFTTSASTLSTATSTGPRKVTTTGPQAVHWPAPDATPTVPAQRNSRRFIS